MYASKQILILDFLRGQENPMTAKSIAYKTGLDLSAVKQVLRGLRKDGTLRFIGANRCFSARYTITQGLW